MVFWPDFFSEEKISYSPIRFIDGVNPVKPVAPPDKKEDKPIKETDPVKKENKKTEKTPPPADQVSIDSGSQKQASAKSFVSLDFDSSKPGAPDKTIEENRFPDRGRNIFIPILKFDESGAKIVSPLPANGVEKNEDRGGFVLIEPKSSAMDNFNSIDAPSQAVAALFEHLSKKYPNLEDSVVWRLAKVGTYVAIDVPLMVASHEMGHGGAAIDSCPSCSPSVVVTSWMSGYTQYNAPRGEFTPQEDLFTSVAGMNQATFNGEEVNRRMHTQGADVADAVRYLVNITNSVNYQMKDWIKKSEPGYNDAATYHFAMEERQKGWNQENLSMLALGVNLLNADFWASLIGTVNYVATGKQVKMPELEIGNVAVSMPHFSLMHTYEGPQLNVSLFGHMKSQETLELKYSQILTPDNGPAFGLETRLHNFAIPGTNNQLSLSPRVGVSLHDDSIGYKVGSGLEYRPLENKNISFSAGLDYTNNYMPEQPLPGMKGLQGNMGINLSF